MQLQKEVKSNPKQPGCEKMCVALKKAIVKIQGGSQEMTVMVR